MVVGFPATPLLLARARICISASHSREDLIKALQVNKKLASLALPPILFTIENSILNIVLTINDFEYIHKLIVYIINCLRVI